MYTMIGRQTLFLLGLVSFLALSGAGASSGGGFGQTGGISGNALPPTKPATVTVTPECAMEIVQWSPSAGATSFNVLRSPSSSGPFTVIASGLPISPRTYSDTTCDYQTTYYYEVSGTNSVGTGPHSDPASATTLPAQFNLTASVIGTQINLSWPTYSPEVQVLRATFAGGPYTILHDFASNSSAYSDKPSFGNTYYYRLFSPTEGWITADKSASPSLMSVPGQIQPNPTNGILPDPMVLPAWMEHTMTSDESDAPGGGPSSAFSADLAHGVVTVEPCVDLLAANPTGPDALFIRTYRTTLAQGNLSSPGLPPGWTHNWDFRLVPSDPASWAPLTLVYPSGATETLSPVLSGGTPTGAFAVPTAAPYVVTGSPSGTTGVWTSITFQYNGLAKDIYGLAPGDTCYRLTTQIGSNGQPVNLTYSSGQLTQIDNASGGSPTMELSLSYSSGLLDHITDSGTGNTRYYHYSGGELQYVSMINNSLAADWSFGYTTINGQPYLNTVTTKDPSNTARTATMSYDTSTGCAQSLTDAKSNVRTYSYSPSGGGGAAVGTGGSTTDQNTTTCDALGRMLSSTSAANDTTQVQYSATNPSEITQITRQSGNAETISLDPIKNLRPGTITYPFGNQVVITWAFPDEAPLGRITRIQEFGRNGEVKQPTLYEYYAAGDPDGPLGYLKRVTTPLGDVVTYTYTALGNTSTVDDGRTRLTYNYSTKIDGTTGTELLGRPYSVTDKLNRTTKFDYDSAGRVIEVLDPMLKDHRQSYNEYDQPVTTTIDYGSATLQRAITLAYNVNGKNPYQTKLDAPGFSTETLNTDGFDQESALGSSTDENNNTLAQSLDPLFGTSSVSNPLALMHQFTPNYAARQFTAQVGTGSKSIAARSTFGHVGQLSDWIQTSGSDGRHLTISTTDPRDPDFPTGTTMTASSSSSEAQTISYDGYGRVLEAEFDSGAGPFFIHDYTYDDQDDVLTDSVSSPGNFNSFIKYTYNLDGTRNTMWVKTTDATQGVLYQYAYDDADRLTSITCSRTDSSGNVTNPGIASASYEYDDADHVLVVRTANGVTHYTYDDLGELIGLQNMSGDNNRDVNAPAILSAPDPDNSSITRSLFSAFDSFHYDTQGNRLSYSYVSEIQLAPSGFTSTYKTGSATFTYDPGKRLTNEVWTTSSSSETPSSISLAHLYDQAGNITKLRGTTMSVDSASDQLSPTSGTQYSSVTFNSSGDMKTWGVSPSTNMTATYAASDYLTAANGKSRANSDSATTSETMYEDSLGHRVYDAVTGYATYSDAIVYDGDSIAYRRVPGQVSISDFGLCPVGSDLSGAPNVFYIIGPTGPVVEFDLNSSGQSTQKSFSYDPQGSCLLTVGGVQPFQQLGQVFYDAYGSVLWKGGLTFWTPQSVSQPLNQPFQYKGQFGYYTDAHAGLCYCLNRCYDPGSGRWTSRDPIGLDGGVNTYAYAGGNPVMNADPSGLQAIPPGIDPSSPYALNQFMNWNVGAAQGQEHYIQVLKEGAKRGLRENLDRVDFVLNVALLFIDPELEGAELGGAEVISWLNRGREVAEAAQVTSSEARGYAVYRSINTETKAVQYIGQTGRFGKRAVEQAGRFVIERIPGLSSLTKGEARSVEQVLIEFHKLGKNGGSLLNKINSIARKNPIYARSMREGAEILRKVGYPGF